MDPATIAMWSSFSLLGAAASLGVMGVHLNLSNQLASPYAPQVRAIHLLPLAVVLPAAFGNVGPVLLASRLGFRLPVASSTTIGFVGLATGLCAAALPLALSCARICGTWIHSHFVLSDWPLRFLQFGLLLLVLTLPLMGMGFTGYLAHALAHPSGERRQSAVRPAIGLGFLTGIAAGILVATLLATRPAMILPATALPMLLLAVIAGRSPDFPPAVAASKPT